MLEHLRWHFAHLLTMELGIPYQPWSASEVQGYLAEAVIHRQTVSVAFDASLVAQGLQKAFSQGDTRVLDGVMLIDIKVALGVDGEVHHAMLADLFQHMVEEAQTCGYVTLARAVKVHADVDVGLLGGALHLSDAVASKENFCYLVPVHSVLAEDEALAAQVLCQLRIRLSVSNHITLCEIVLRIVDVFLQHADSWLAHRRVVLREMAVDELLLEVYSFALQSLDDEVVDRPECVFREGIGA